VMLSLQKAGPKQIGITDNNSISLYAQKKKHQTQLLLLKISKIALLGARNINSKSEEAIDISSYIPKCYIPS